VYLIMIMKKNASKTSYKLNGIWRNSNIDYDIYRAFNAFPLNLTPFENLHIIPTGPWGFITVPISIPYHTHGNPHGNPHTHASPGKLRIFIYASNGYIQSNRQSFQRDDTDRTLEVTANSERARTEE